MFGNAGADGGGGTAFASINLITAIKTNIKFSKNIISSPLILFDKIFEFWIQLTNSIQKWRLEFLDVSF